MTETQRQIDHARDQARATAESEAQKIRTRIMFSVIGAASSVAVLCIAIESNLIY